MVLEELNHHKLTIDRVIAELVPQIERACTMITETVSSGAKVLLAGNGGSAADAQHIAAELTGRFVRERKALPAIALTVDTSALTAISNDYGYEMVFQRQVEALARTSDLFIGISTSGNSPNILNALIAAKKIGCKTLGLSGKDGGQMNELCDINIIIPENNTARIQEMHILIGHILCKAVDEQY
ncbi:D-sedoheptulose 7-phosphate isomerase [Pedobacter africanus]|uniref:D-sedoheptulose 7-phosphate isomerase n=1 Tax=Pedobacter africanus TaxID=151894 RepID=A0ACC6L0L9_9SPHI|nr:D-sedoheptulose 7-phosphate isomerase [Pedobacter africanus]MDR6784928.1 D-sedoheptulose 7-phosphate isomerase [Pedobacter africanus]